MDLTILIPILSVALWAVYVTGSRINKRKAYGNLLLSVRDNTYISDICWGVGYIILGIILSIRGMASGNNIYSPYTYLIFFLIFSVTYFIRASFKIEIRELGILSKDSHWSWEDVENCYSRPLKNATIITFKFKNSKVKARSISINKKDELEVESKLKNLL